MTKGIVYLLKNETYNGLVKIGITSKTIEERMGELYKTGVPTPFTCHYAIELDNYDKVEKALHFAFQKYRPNESREFFDIEPEQVVAILKLLEPADAKTTTELTVDENGKEIETEVNNEENTNNYCNFEKLGIKIGSELTFSRDENVKCTVGENNKVIYNNEVYSPTALVKKLLGTNNSLSGYQYLQYKGETIFTIKKRFEKEMISKI